MLHHIQREGEVEPLLGNKVFRLAWRDGGSCCSQFQHDVAKLSELAKTFTRRLDGGDVKSLRRQLTAEQKYPPPTSSNAAPTGNRARSSDSQSRANRASAAIVSNSERNSGACASTCERIRARNPSMHAFTRFRLLLNANTHCAVDHASYAGRNAPILIPIRVGRRISVCASISASLPTAIWCRITSHECLAVTR